MGRFVYCCGELTINVFIYGTLLVFSPILLPTLYLCAWAKRRQMRQMLASEEGGVINIAALTGRKEE